MVFDHVINGLIESLEQKENFAQNKIQFLREYFAPLFYYSTITAMTSYENELEKRE